MAGDEGQMDAGNTSLKRPAGVPSGKFFEILVRELFVGQGPRYNRGNKVLCSGGGQPASRAGNPPRQRADTLASTWPLLAAMNRSRYSHGKARKGALIFVRQRLMRANLDRLSVIRDGPI
jgi:hypothetical protein